MCEICGKTTCDSRCPNAAEPEPIYECNECGSGIYEGDEFYELTGEYFCKDCLDAMSARDMLDLQGESLERAKQHGY